MKNKLSEQQIEYIIQDIRARGVEMESLQQSLLDHICCILENEIDIKDDFESKYKDVLKKYFNENLEEIEKETLLLLHNKHYYLMKNAGYILLFVSLSINILAIGGLVKNYVKERRELSEITIIPGISLADATKDLIFKIKTIYPQQQIKNKIYVSFSGDSYFFGENLLVDMADAFDITVDSLKRQQKFRKDEKYRKLDSLAGKYPETTFVVAFIRTSDDVDDEMKDYSKKTKHLLFLKGMQHLYSGFQNTKGNFKGRTNGPFFENFVINQNGDLLYYQKKIWIDGYDKELINVLSEKAL